MALVFIPQEALDALADMGRVDLVGDELVVLPQQCRYRVKEAVRVLREVATGEDPLTLCGTVRERSHLVDELGGELLGDSILIEDAAYDVVTGMLCSPIGELDGQTTDGKGELDVLRELAAKPTGA